MTGRIGRSGSPAPRVAFQGELGAFSEEALRSYFGESADPLPRRELREVGKAVVGGDAHFGLLPVENSLAGTVIPAYDVLAHPEITIVGEEVRPIRHCLLGIPGSRLEGVRRVISHPIALAQCVGFFAAHPEAEAVAVYDTAGAAKEVSHRGDSSLAAIAARGAAERYGLVVLAEDLQDRSDNQTRFLVVARAGMPRPDANLRTTSWKSALLVETDNRPGALVDVLEPIARRGVNLSKLESRPGATPWSYRFFLELEADADTGVAGDAVDEIRRSALSVRLLGSFPRATNPRPTDR